MKEMIIINPNADLPPSILALPIELRRNGKSSAPQATSATLRQPVITAETQRTPAVDWLVLDDCITVEQPRAIRRKARRLPDPVL
jgi:hypothetical protein